MREQTYQEIKIRELTKSATNPPKDALPDMIVLARDLITLEELWPASAR